MTPFCNKCVETRNKISLFHWWSEIENRKEFYKDEMWLKSKSYIIILHFSWLSNICSILNRKNNILSYYHIVKL